MTTAPNSMSKRFIFIGASSRVGQMLSRFLPHESECGLSIDWQYRTPRQTSNAFHWPDLSDSTPLKDLTALRGGIDGAFVFCGVTPMRLACGKADLPSSLSDNAALAVNALNACSDAGLKRVLLASSSAVYGAGVGTAFSESDPTSPVNAYGAAKLEMEAACVKRAQELGIELCCLRVGNVAGADALLGGAQRDSEPVQLDVFPDGDGPRRSYIGPVTLAHVLAELAMTPEDLPDILNIGTSSPSAMNALLNEAGLEWAARPVEASAFQDIHLNCSRLEALLPAYTFQQSPRDIISEWYSATE